MSRAVCPECGAPLKVRANCPAVVEFDVVDKDSEYDPSVVGEFKFPRADNEGWKSATVYVEQDMDTPYVVCSANPKGHRVKFHTEDIFVAEGEGYS